MMQKGTVLVVEDDSEWQELISFQCMALSYEVKLASTYVKAQELLQDGHFDICIVDLNLEDSKKLNWPNCGGKKVLDFIKENNITIKILIISAFGTGHSVRELFKTYGVDDFIDKRDFNANKFKETVSGIFMNEIQKIVKDGESNMVEFKSSSRWDYNNNLKNREMENVIAETIVAFLNSQGGKLIIGVDDEGLPIGLKSDYGTLKNKNRDGYERFLFKLISNNMGKGHCKDINVRFYEIEEKDVCVVDINPSPCPVYIDGKLFVRTGNQKQQLNTREAVDYIKERWPK